MATQNPIPEIIRFAIQQRRCIELGYNGTSRLVEPYGLRLSPKGDLLLQARKMDTQVLRTYRVDRIEYARLTDITFEPVFAIEMSGGGPIIVRPPL